MRVQENVSELTEEYRAIFENYTFDSSKSITNNLVQEADWTEQAAEHLLQLAENYGSFMLRNALALSIAFDNEDGKVGF